MFIGLLVSQAIILNDSGPVPRDLILSVLLDGNRRVLRHYTLSGSDTLDVKLKSELSQSKLPSGFGGDWHPSPHGDRFVVRGIDQNGEKGVVVVWRINPLSQVAVKKISPSSFVRWLYGRNSVAVVGETGSGLVGWIISAKTGRTAGPMKNVLAFADRPGSSTILRVRCLSVRDGAKNLLADRSGWEFSEALRKGKLVFEESANLRKWRAVSPLSAAKHYVWAKSGSKQDLHWLMNRSVIGFQDSWLLRWAKEYEVTNMPATHWVDQDDLYSDKKRVAHFQRPRWDGSSTTMAVSLSGDVTLSAPATSDEKVEKWYEAYLNGPLVSKEPRHPIMALRYGAKGSRRWLIPEVPPRSSGLILWK